MATYRVEEGRQFRKSIQERCSGLPRIERYIDALKEQLSHDPFVGERLSKDVPRFVYEMKTGTLDWRVLVEYFVHEDFVELMQVYPVRP